LIGRDPVNIVVRQQTDVMPKLRTQVPDDIRLEVISRCNNRCCVCQTPFVVVHHLDEDPSNNDIDNLAPLCPNCHSQTHSHAGTTMNLTADRVRKLRDRWYTYCENRKDVSTTSSNAILKMLNFVRSAGLPQHSWSRTFSVIHPEYANMAKTEMVQCLFRTTNPDDLVELLETVKNMYAEQMSEQQVREKFERVCNAFGVDFNELI
jgi:hypothetical protein